MEATDEAMEVTYEEVEVPVFDSNHPSTSSNEIDVTLPFAYAQPKWNKREYAFSKTPVDLSKEKYAEFYETIGNTVI